MKTYLKILIVLITFLSINGCVMRDGKIQRVSFSGAAIKTMDDVEKQRGYLSNEKNKAKAIKLLIEAYNNKNLNHEVRMASLEALAESKDKLVLEAIQKSVRNAELLDLEMMTKSVELLSEYGDLESIDALVTGLKKSESKIMN